MTCHNCGSAAVSIFHQVGDVPVHSCLLMETREVALGYPRGEIRLGFCSACGFIANMAFNPDALEYSASYEETQGFSPRFRAFAREMACELVDRYDLRGKDVLEIGCGKGEFLALLCELGGNRGIGFDPAYVPGRVDEEAAARIEVVPDFYSETYAHVAADLVLCRMTLEHIQPTREFVGMVRRAIGNRLETVVVFQVPDVERILREVAFWDVYYEHCSYFSLGSLARLFRASGFDVLRVGRDFDDQYISIECRPAATAPGGGIAPVDDLAILARDVEHFATGFPRKLAEWQAELRRVAGQGRRPVIWGGGSKAVTYLTTLGVRDEIAYVVDINPFKHGKFIAGAGHEVVPPEFLREYRPELVIAMNPTYREEIRRSLDELGVRADLVAV